MKKYRELTTDEKIERLDGKPIEAEAEAEADGFNRFNRWADMLTAYEQSAIDGSGTATADALYTTAYAFISAVIKKLHMTTGDDKLLNYLYGARKEISRMNKIKELSLMYVIEYDGNGNAVTVNTADDKRVDVLGKALADTADNGADLLQTAVAFLLGSTRKKVIDFGGLTFGFMQREYNIRVIDKRVRINDAGSPKWHDEAVNLSIELYRAICNAIKADGSTKASSLKYIYIEELCKDLESDFETVIYHRLGLYSDLGGYVRDFNGAQTVYTVPAEAVKDTEKIIEALNLTKRERAVLTLRMRGYGNKAIATRLNVTLSTVKTLRRRIMTKAERIGLTATSNA